LEETREAQVYLDKITPIRIEDKRVDFNLITTTLIKIVEGHLGQPIITKD